jgi:hypothetical protein
MLRNKLGAEVLDVVPMTRLRPSLDWGQRPGKKLDCLHGNVAIHVFYARHVVTNTDPSTVNLALVIGRWWCIVSWDVWQVTQPFTSGTLYSSTRLPPICAQTRTQSPGWCQIPRHRLLCLAKHRQVTA